MKFSLCIPNYNYAGYIDRLIKSALAQRHTDFEVLISDNASTDKSVDVVRSFTDPRIKLRVNACNVGFAGNLDKTVQMATGDRIAVVPSDDLLAPSFLSLYQQLLDKLGTAGDRAVISSTVDVIDPSDKSSGKITPDPRMWHESDRAPELEAIAGGNVYKVAGDELLKRALRVMANPFNLTTTVYPRALYDKIEGYGANRIINPDKWYHWRLLGVTEWAFFVDASLASCRWHTSNQTAQQKASGALKFLVDEYVSSFELDVRVLERLGMSRAELEALFVEYDIGRHGLATLAEGDRTKAKRILRFGEATYPKLTRKNQKVWALRALLAAGPLGDVVSKAAYRAYLKTSPRGDSAVPRG
jgi:glycosyltransferase involved in cell wall biosynthesis